MDLCPWMLADSIWYEPTWERGAALAWTKELKEELPPYFFPKVESILCCLHGSTLNLQPLSALLTSSRGDSPTAPKKSSEGTAASIDEQTAEPADLVNPVDKGTILFYPHLINLENESGGQVDHHRQTLGIQLIGIH